MTEHQPDASRAFNRLDVWIALGLAAFASVFMLAHVKHGVTPEEDASMLLRYSKNFAEGHGIVWNVGEHPVEGATDFLFMAMIGLLSRVTHIGVIAVTRALLAVSQACSVAALYLFGRRLFRASVSVALLPALYLSCGTAYHFVDSCFSAPFYGFFALLAWAAALWTISEGITPLRALLFSLLSLTVGLIRPEGNLIAFSMLMAVMWSQRINRRWLISAYLLTMFLLGGSYFLWRWHYFGYLLPNPFYVKHTFSFFSTVLSMRTLLELALPLWPLFAVSFCTRKGRRQFLLLLTVIVPFVAMWTGISRDNNGFHRFDYVLLPVILLSLSDVLTEFEWSIRPLLQTSVNLRRGAMALLAGIAIVGAFYIMHYDKFLYVNPGAYDLAMRLRPMAPKGYSLVSTEAGTLPFFSEWTTIDALALNDSFLAHNHGRFTTAYLDRYKPQLILYKSWRLGPYPPQNAAQQAAADKVFGARVPMVATELRDYALAHGYTLAAVYANDYCDFHYIWVSQSGPDSAAILSAVRDHPYGAQSTGSPTFDFRAADSASGTPGMTATKCSD